MVMKKIRDASTSHSMEGWNHEILYGKKGRAVMKKRNRKKHEKRKKGKEI